MDGPIGDNSLQARGGLYFIVWQLCGDIHNLFFFSPPMIPQAWQEHMGTVGICPHLLTFGWYINPHSTMGLLTPKSDTEIWKFVKGISDSNTFYPLFDDCAGSYLHNKMKIIWVKSPTFGWYIRLSPLDLKMFHRTWSPLSCNTCYIYRTAAA